MSQRIIQQIPLDKIIVGKQIRERFDDESLAGLAQSMRESGQQEPIHVIPLDGERYSLITGGRRVRAMRKAGQTIATAIIEEGNLNKGEILVRQIVENAQREDLSPFEKAKAIELLMKETAWNSGGERISSRYNGRPYATLLFPRSEVAIKRLEPFAVLLIACVTHHFNPPLGTFLITAAICQGVRVGVDYSGNRTREMDINDALVEQQLAMEDARGAQDRY